MSDEVLPLTSVVALWGLNRQVCGQRLQVLRQVAGLSQLELAHRSGVTNDTISRLEQGRQAPQAETIQRLADALEVGPAELVPPPATIWAPASRRDNAVT